MIIAIMLFGNPFKNKGTTIQRTSTLQHKPIKKPPVRNKEGLNDITSIQK